MSAFGKFFVFPQLDGYFTNYFTKPVSSLLCSEPIVVLDGKYEREARTAEGERGIVPVTILVVRDVDADAEAVATAVEQRLRHCDWERHSYVWPWRLVGLDSAAPYFKERDSSGRYVWEVDLTLTVVREI